ncbi:MAG: LytR/AlgR family response regulator transcription factor [Tenacibaculum sp.]
MNCIIIEDELPAQNILKNFIHKIPDLVLINTFQTALSANDYLKENTVDLVLLDINLPDISGLDFIKTVKNPPKIIITTAYPDYAVKSFELDTIVDYLVKPFSFDRFLKAITKAEKRTIAIEKEEREALFLTVDKTVHKIYIDTILYLESDRNYVTFYTKDKKITVIDSLKNWNDRLTKNGFIQIHKTYIVNRKKVSRYTKSYIVLNTVKLPIGRTFKEKTMANL